MPSGLRFDARFTVTVVPDEGACLLSEREEIVLEGAVFAALALRLDGTRDADGLVDDLADTFPAAEVYHAVWGLEERGYVAHGVRGAACRVPRTASRAPIHVRAIGDVPLDAMWDALALRGFTAGDDVAIVLTDDYLHPALVDVNRRALAEHRPWLLAKPVGRSVWAGPVFGMSGGPCWECLRHRLARHRPVFAFLSRRADRYAHPRIPLDTTAESLRLAADLIVRVMAERADAASRPYVLVTEVDEGGLRRHAVIRRPRCPACGTDERMPGPEISPMEEASLIDPLTGIVAAVTPLSDATTDAIHVWVARPSPFANASTLRALQAQRRHQSLGRGWNPAEARASALGEAIERYSATYQGNEPRVRATFRELADRAIHPNACMLFSEAQYRQRAERGDSSVPLPIDPDVPLDWTAVRSLGGGAPRYLPTALVYYEYPQTPAEDYCRADSNGCAAGTTLDNAVRNGLFEIIERDAVAVWWYNRIARPAVPLIADVDSVLPSLQSGYERTGRSFWALDITSDFGIPVFAAVTRCQGPTPDVLVGFGCHTSATEALRRAVSEMHQMVVALGAVADRRALAPTTQRWLAEATPEDQPQLLPAGESRWPPPTNGVDADGDPGRVLERHGFTVFVADLTRPDVGTPVVKVIAPGLRSQRLRFAPGRLFEVPVALGWRQHSLREGQLNPLPVFL
jgi:oxazoline/thiazoline synthase